jgi:hypothetical protein
MASDKPAPPRRRASATAAPTRLITAAETRKIETRSIEVADGETLELSRGHPEYGSCCSRVVVSNFADLQMLGLAPRGLTQERVRAAIAADDEEAFRMASGMVQRGTPRQGCDCAETEGAPRQVMPRSANPVRSAMSGLRARHNPSLARVLSEQHGRTFAYDSPAVGMLRKMSDRLEFTHIEFEAIHLADIFIGGNATLSIASGATVVAARHIYIEQSGTLRLNAGYTKIWANSIGRFRVKMDTAIVAAGAKMTPIWLDD